MTSLPERHYPAHPSPIASSGKSTIVYVTMCVHKRRALLANSTAHRLLVETWRQAQAWRIGRYTVMPEHIHFFCAPLDGNHSLKQWMSFWRNAFTRAWPQPDDKPIWQREYWDTQLRQGESYSAKWDYVCQNPVRCGLVAQADDWPYQGELEELSWDEPT